MKRPCVYILASRRNGTLYVGVTADIVSRVWDHRSGAVDGFTKTYGVHLLVYVEFHETMAEAILREKQDESSSKREDASLPFAVIPAKAGIQGCKRVLVALDPGFRWGDGKKARAMRYICDRPALRRARGGSRSAQLKFTVGTVIAFSSAVNWAISL